MVKIDVGQSMKLNMNFQQWQCNKFSWTFRCFRRERLTRTWWEVLRNSSEVQSSVKCVRGKACPYLSGLGWGLGKTRGGPMQEEERWPLLMQWRIPVITKLKVAWEEDNYSRQLTAPPTPTKSSAMSCQLSSALSPDWWPRDGYHQQHHPPPKAHKCSKRCENRLSFLKHVYFPTTLMLVSAFSCTSEKFFIHTVGYSVIEQHFNIGAIMCNIISYEFFRLLWLPDWNSLSHSLCGRVGGVWWEVWQLLVSTAHLAPLPLTRLTACQGKRRQCDGNIRLRRKLCYRSLLAL